MLPRVLHSRWSLLALNGNIVMKVKHPAAVEEPVCPGALLDRAADMQVVPMLL